MYQLILEKSLSDRSSVRRLFGKARNLVLRFHDPLVTYQLQGRPLTLPLSHPLPAYRREFPTYSANLTRITRSIRSWFGHLSMIDVGANIGDSYCLTDAEGSDQYLLVEPDRRYFDLLIRNTKHDAAVTRVCTLLSDSDGPLHGVIQSEHGTARVTIQPDAPVAECTTVDALLELHPAFRSSNILKTDVDGFDSRVIRGAKALLARQKPVIFFEHYPRMLLDAGDDPMGILGELDRLGYTQLLLYDNLGFPITTLHTSDLSLARDFMAYAQSRDTYYDICAIHDVHREHRDQFIHAEQALFRTLK